MAECTEDERRMLDAVRADNMKAVGLIRMEIFIKEHAADVAECRRLWNEMNRAAEKYKAAWGALEKGGPPFSVNDGSLDLIYDATHGKEE